MNDQDNKKQPSWVKSHLRGGEGEDHNLSLQHLSDQLQKQSGGDQSRKGSRGLQARENGEKEAGISDGVLGGMLRPCYNFVSMIGHCGLVCEKFVRSWFSSSVKSSNNRFLNYGLSLLFVALVGGSVLYYMMGWRALPVTFLKAQIESALAANMGGARLKIDDAFLLRDTKRGGFYVRLTNMELIEPDGAVVVASPEIAIGLKFLPLLVGSVAPNSLSVVGPELHLLLNKQGEWSFLRAHTGAVAKSGKEELQALDNSDLDGKRADQKLEGQVISAEGLGRIGDVVKQGLARVHKELQLVGALSYIGVRDARLVLHRSGDDQGEVWLMPSFTLQYDQDEKKRLLGSGKLAPQASVESEVWLTLSHSQGDHFFDANLRLENVVPSQLSTFIPALSSLSTFKLGVTGAFTGRIDLSEGVRSGQLKVGLSEGTMGIFGPAGPEFEISRGFFNFAMKAGAKHIVLQEGELLYPAGRISLKGDIWRDNVSYGSQDWRFQIYSTSGEIVSKYPTVDGKKIDEFGFSGRLFVSKLPVLIDEMRLKIGQSSLLMAHDGSLGYPAILRGRFQSIPLDLLKTVWPVGFNQKSRDWIVKYVKSGVIRKGDFAVDGLGRGETLLKFAQAGQSGVKQKIVRLPEMNFQINGFSYKVFDDPLLVKSDKVDVKIEGKRLTSLMKQGFFDVPGGGRVALRDAQYIIPDYELVEPDSVARFKLKTSAETSLALLKREPFGFSSPLEKKLKNMKGEVSADLSVKMPIRDEVLAKDVDIGGKVTLSRAEAMVGQFKIKDGLVDFVLGRNHVDAKGVLLINGVSASLVWSRQFNQSPKYEIPPLLIRAELDAADRNQLGLPVNEVVEGVMPVEITFKERLNKALDVHVAANLTNTALISHGLGWRKEAGRSASLDFDVVEVKDSSFVLENFNIEGQDLTARGRLVLDKQSEVKSFSFPKISYKVVSNISLNGERFKVGAGSKKKIWKVRAVGQTYDGRGVLRSLLHRGQVGQGKSVGVYNSDGIELTGKFKTVIGWGQAKLNDFTINMKRRGDQLERFRIKGKFGTSGSLTGRLVSSRGQDPIIRVETSDAGEALRLVGFYPNMLGGRGQLTVRYNVKKRQLASKTGELVIQKFRIASDPVVREVLSNVGAGKEVVNASSQDVIPFSRLYAPFSIGHEQFILHDSYIKGDLLGATMRGEMDFQRNRVRLSGTYIPLYGLNAAVGAVPVLGDILIGRRGEGMLGITFGIYGNISKPEVLVNPMSLVAPGVFRQIFEFEQKAPAIQARPGSKVENSIKLNSSASKVRRLKSGEGNNKSRIPETSSTLQRK